MDIRNAIRQYRIRRLDRKIARAQSTVKYLESTQFVYPETLYNLLVEAHMHLHRLIGRRARVAGETT